MAAAVLVLLLALMAAGCATPTPAALPVPASPLQLAVNRLTDAVLGQALRQRGAPPAWGSFPPQTLEVLPVVDPRDGRTSAVGEQTARWIVEQIGRQHPAYVVAQAGAASPRWRLAARLTPQGDDGPAPHPHVLMLELVDATSGEVVASARERVVDPLLDASFEAARQLRQAAAPVAKPPPPPVAAVDPLDALRAEYLALVKEGREAQAQVAFGRMLELGLARRSVSMKILFAPGSTAFWPDPELARRYPGWLAELAQQTSKSPHCLRIVGHASRVGSDAANRRLSLRRAQAVRQIMLSTRPELATKLSVVGMGESRTIVGSEADDQHNAADRRVEFEVVDCPPGP
jgi:outer membrane protein OmpA-like peptidoglycan-associated protein